MENEQTEFAPDVIECHKRMMKIYTVNFFGPQLHDLMAMIPDEIGRVTKQISETTNPDEKRALRAGLQMVQGIAAQIGKCLLDLGFNPDEWYQSLAEIRTDPEKNIALQKYNRQQLEIEAALNRVNTGQPGTNIVN